ncbi:hypothetical protein [Psychromicrobium sp. YIM B11713]|uniref:hypothetical protein n=1 Tax=Psychromicrobium sp. YIM B11713 TaxID=3145233 RepID=UPI00374E63A4
MRKLMATATVIAALSIPLITASTANAVSGGNYSTQGQCNQAGKNIVDHPNSVYSSWTCTRTSGSAPWHLDLKK